MVLIGINARAGLSLRICPIYLLKGSLLFRYKLFCARSSTPDIRYTNCVTTVKRSMSGDDDTDPVTLSVTYAKPPPITAVAAFQRQLISSSDSTE